MYNGYTYYVGTGGYKNTTVISIRSTLYFIKQGVLLFSYPSRVLNALGDTVYWFAVHFPHTMPITSDDLRELIKVLLDDYLRNIPIDQIGVERPLLKRCLAKCKLFFCAIPHMPLLTFFGMVHFQITLAFFILGRAGTAMSVASITVPLLSINPLSLSKALTHASICAARSRACKKYRKRRIVLSSGNRFMPPSRPAKSRYSGTSCSASSMVGSGRPNYCCKK